MVWEGGGEKRELDGASRRQRQRCRRGRCAACNSCPHGKVNYDCTDCNACPHGKRKTRCAACKAARAAPPSSKRVKREPESSPEIKEEPEVKQEPEIKQEPFTIRGYFGFGDEDGGD